MRATRLLPLAVLLAIFLFSSFIIPKFFRFSPKADQQINELYLENQSLKSRLTASLPEFRGDFKLAKVYSSYPFNDKNEIAINLGSADGIKESWPVVLGSDIVLGEVKKVFEHYSLVRTIFDPEWRLAVRIGENKINALLEGGVEPSLTTIDKNKVIKEGDFIYAVAKGFPYGALIGKVQNISSSPSSIFQEASLALPYNFNNEIVEVKILTGYGL